MLGKLVTSKMSCSWSVVGCCVKGGSVIFHSLYIGIMLKLKDRFAHRHAVILHSSQVATQRYVTCHFPSRRFRGTPPVGRGEGTNYRDSQSWRSWTLWHVACVVILAGSPLLGEPKNCFTRVLPTVSVPCYLGMDSVCVHTQIQTHSFASTSYTQLLTHKTYIKETYKEWGWMALRFQEICVGVADVCREIVWSETAVKEHNKSHGQI